MSTSMKGRIIVRKKKEPIPKISISGYYQSYKIYMHLTLEEIVALIGKKRRECSYVMLEENLNRIKTDIKLLEDLYKIKRASSVDLFNRYREEKKDKFFTTELGIIAHCILNYLGYRTPIYTEECIMIAGKIDRSNLILEDIKNEVAAGIVKEILVYYNAEFDEEKIIRDYNIDENKFYNYYLSIHRWCKKNYWQK